MHPGDWDRSLYDQPEMDAIEERAERGHRIDAGTLRVMLTEQQRRDVCAPTASRRSPPPG